VLKAKANAKNPKNYDFTASVSGFGLAAPTKTADFTDITANTDLGIAALDPKTVSHGFGKALVTNASSAPAQSVVADLNGDGFPDIATANAGFGPSTVAVFLGKGDGTFAAVREFNTTQSQGYEVTIADLNGNGAPDLISSDVHASIGVLLNRGEGEVVRRGGSGNVEGRGGNRKPAQRRFQICGLEIGADQSERV